MAGSGFAVLFCRPKPQCPGFALLGGDPPRDVEDRGHISADPGAAFRSLKGPEENAVGMSHKAGGEVQRDGTWRGRGDGTIG